MVAEDVWWIIAGIVILTAALRWRNHHHSCRPKR
jgi:hypothetical protein